MSPIDIEEAKSRLSQLVNAIKSGAATEIVITEGGVPVARLVPIEVVDPKARAQAASFSTHSG